MAEATEEKKTITVDEMRKSDSTADGLKSAFEARQNAAQGTLGGYYDNSLQTQRQGLQDAYNQNVQARQEAEASTRSAFAEANRDLTNQSGRVQRGMDSFADVRNLNRQAGSQQALGLNLGRQTGAGAIATRRNLALQENQRQTELLKTNYQNQVAQALADSDYKKAAALLDDYNNQNQWQENQAKILASYGNFTGYENLYGADQAGAMRDLWIAQNPELAYNTGAIDSNRYKEITGLNPPDYVAPASYNWGNVAYWDSSGVPHYPSSGGSSGGSISQNPGRGGGGYTRYTA